MVRVLGLVVRRCAIFISQIYGRAPASRCRHGIFGKAAKLNIEIIGDACCDARDRLMTSRNVSHVSLSMITKICNFLLQRSHVDHATKAIFVTTFKTRKQPLAKITAVDCADRRECAKSASPSAIWPLANGSTGQRRHLGDKHPHRNGNHETKDNAPSSIRRGLVENLLIIVRSCSIWHVTNKPLLHSSTSECRIMAALECDTVHVGPRYCSGLTNVGPDVSNTLAVIWKKV